MFEKIGVSARALNVRRHERAILNLSRRGANVNAENAGDEEEREVFSYIFRAFRAE